MAPGCGLRMRTSIFPARSRDIRVTFGHSTFKPLNRGQPRKASIAAKRPNAPITANANQAVRGSAAPKSEKGTRISATHINNLERGTIITYYLGTAICCRICSITSGTLSPSISNSGRRMSRCSSTGTAMALMSSGVTKSCPEIAA